jgi:hypothetical protein
MPNTLPSEGYRPGSTGRATSSSDVQKASYDTGYGAPATSAPAASSEASGGTNQYPSTGAPAPSYDSIYR